MKKFLLARSAEGPMDRKIYRGTDTHDGIKCRGCGATHEQLIPVCGECHGIAVKTRQEDAVATGPCIGCGERNHTAHHVSICATCVDFTRDRGGHMQTSDGRWLHGLRRESAQGDSLTPRKLQLQLTHFEAAMVLCVLAVAKEGKSQFDSKDMPLRRRALEQAYAKVSAALGVEEPCDV